MNDFDNLKKELTKSIETIREDCKKVIEFYKTIPYSVGVGYSTEEVFNILKEREEITMDKTNFSTSPAKAIKAYTEFTTNLKNSGRVTQEFLDKLISLEYTRSPASTKYHGNHTCGLLCHSVVVAECLKYLEKELDIHFQKPESAIIVGLFHDLCKLGRYEYDTEKQEWGYVKDKDRKTATFGGHATESLALLLTNGVNLTEEEALCIRFHMGAYETNDWDAFDAAIKRYPTVLLTHMADMMASKFFNT